MPSERQQKYLGLKCGMFVMHLYVMSVYSSSCVFVCVSLSSCMFNGEIETQKTIRLWPLCIFSNWWVINTYRLFTTVIQFEMKSKSKPDTIRIRNKFFHIFNCEQNKTDFTLPSQVKWMKKFFSCIWLGIRKPWMCSCLSPSPVRIHNSILF